MISGQWFQRKRSFKFELAKNSTKIIHNSMKNRGSTLILTNLVWVYLRKIHRKFGASPLIGLIEVKNCI